LRQVLTEATSTFIGNSPASPTSRREVVSFNRL
jgi:hypothetical protein